MAFSQRDITLPLAYFSSCLGVVEKPTHHYLFHLTFLFFARHFRIYSFIYSRWYRFRSNCPEAVEFATADALAVNTALCRDKDDEAVAAAGFTRELFSVFGH